MALTAWACVAKRGERLDWVITLFQASVMPNTIIVGIPVLSPLFSITGLGIAAIFIGQVLWLYPVLFLYELRVIMIKHTAQVQAPDATAHHHHHVTAPALNAHPHHLNGIPGTSRHPISQILHSELQIIHSTSSCNCALIYEIDSRKITFS